jgi:hypothetical protein
MSGFLRGFFPIFMNPGTLFTDIGDIEKIGIEAFRRNGISKGDFVHPRGTGRDHHPIDGKFADILLD